MSHQRPTTSTEPAARSTPPEGIGIGDGVVWTDGLRRLALRHSLFGVLLTLGVAIRAVYALAYPSGFWYPDTDAYATFAKGGFLYAITVFRPAGYSWWLAGVDIFGGVRLAALLQHGIGVLLAVAIYCLLVRRAGSSPLLACCGVSVALFAPSVIASEHSLLSEAMFLPAAVLGLVLLVSTAKRQWLFPMLAAVLLSAATLFRSVGIGLVVLGALYLVINLRWRSLGNFAAVTAVILAPYVFTYHSLYGHYAMTGYEGGFLYSRVAPIADCAALPVGTPDAFLCDENRPVGQRPDGTFYLWGAESPVVGIPFEERNERLGAFARTVIMNEPGDYLRLVGADMLTYFDLGNGGEDPSIACSALPRGIDPPENFCAGRVAVKNLDLSAITPDVNQAMVGIALQHSNLLTWPRWLMVPLVVAPFGLLVRRPGRRRRLAGPFLAGTGMALLVAPALTSVFDYRYGLVTAVLLPIAVAVAVADFRAGTPSVVTDGSALKPVPDAEALPDSGPEPEEVVVSTETGATDSEPPKVADNRI